MQDQLIATLTVPQLVKIAIGASLGYVVWDQLRWIPTEVRLIVAVAVTLVGVAFALVRPGGRALDQWLLAWMLYRILPRRMAWRPGSEGLHQAAPDRTEWAELELRPEWPGIDTCEGEETANPHQVHTQFLTRWTKS